MIRRRHARSEGRLAALALGGSLVACAAVAGGCAVAGIAAVAGKAIEESGTRTVEAEYTGLAGKSFAVVVAADRIIQTDYPGAADYIAIEVSRILHDNAGASAFIPPGDVLTYLARNPAWQGKPLEELGADLGVERLVYIDLYEYRLHEPGNAYEWDGVAAGRVAVVEVDSPAAGAYAYDRVVQVRFPGRVGVDRDTMSRQMVNTGLAQRFVNRSAWLFFTHEEPNKIEY